MVIKISTPRLLLREFETGDEQLLLDLNADWEVVKFTGNLPIKGIDEARQVLEEIILPQYAAGLGRWAVHLREGNEFIGWCGLKNINGKIDLGYRFFVKYWGRGFATESARAVLNYGFEQLKLPNIIAHAALENVPSIHVLEKLGMLKTGQGVEDGIPVQGFGMSREQWSGSVDQLNS